MTDTHPDHATRPTRIPRGGWVRIAMRVWTAIGKNHVGLIAAGIAFYGLLALFPAITALVAIGGLVLDPAEITAQIDTYSALLPASAADIIRDQATDVAGSSQTGLGLAAVGGLGLALYSASRGVSSLIEGLNVAYGETDDRGFVRQTALKLALTLFLVVGVIVGLASAVILPGILGFVDLGFVTEWLIRIGRWVVLLALTVLGIGVLYRFGPDRRGARWRWLTPGAALACGLWLMTSVGFAFYAENFARYNESFGTLSGVIVLLTWMWISAYVLLLGASVNAEAEYQTRADTTVGPDRPMGTRGAVKADTAPPRGAAAETATSG